MAGHDIIVIGGAVGGIEALSALLAGLPADLPAAVCVVLHQSAFSPNRHPELFARESPLPVVMAEQGMPLQPGRVYLSVPDVHLIVERRPRAPLGTLRLTRGPRENRARPAVDPLFRTAALAFGRRVIGVILSGALDDGSSGLWVIRDRGGLAVVQDPRDAAMSGMPTVAIEDVGADYVRPAAELGPLLGRLARRDSGEPGEPEEQPRRERTSRRRPARPPAPLASSPDDVEREVAIGALDEGAHARSERYGVPSRFACPDCGGVLWAASPAGPPLHYRCETGHSYGEATLSDAQTEAVEAACWAALRALEDKAELARLRASLARERGLDLQARELDVQLAATQAHASAIRELLRMETHGPHRPPARPRLADREVIDDDRPLGRGGVDHPSPNDLRR